MRFIRLGVGLAGMPAAASVVTAGHRADEFAATSERRYISVRLAALASQAPQASLAPVGGL